MHKFWVGWRLWWTGLATCTNAVPQRLTWSEYLMEASVQGILQYVLQSDMSCHGSLSELELVVSRWFCGVGDPCGWGCWHFWLQLAQVNHHTKATAKCRYMTPPPLINKLLTYRNRCPKGHSCSEDVSNDGSHHQIPLLLFLRIPEGREGILCNIHTTNSHLFSMSFLSIYSVDRWHWQILHPTQFVTQI